MKSSDPNGSLSRLLAAWRLAPPPNPNFRPAVWQRLRQQSRETWAGYVRAHLAGWSLLAVLSVAAAGWTGHSVARAKLEADREQMVVSYLGGLDPRVLVRQQP